MLKLQSRAHDWVSNQVYWRGWQGYEPESVSLFFRLASHSRITFDVGAYVGFYSLLAAHANENGRVYAFEPLPAACERLRRNIELNHIYNVEIVDRAVGEINGVAEFFTASTQLPCSSSLSYEFMQSYADLYSTPISVITLDNFVQEHDLSGIDLVKIDTESTEPQVLCGMYKTLERDKPFILCEVLGRGSERPLEEILGPLGYRYYHLTPDGPIQRERIEGHPEWLNYLFATLDSETVARL